jgi:hypothetical protein
VWEKGQDDRQGGRFVIPSAARDLAWIGSSYPLARSLAALGMTNAVGQDHRYKSNRSSAPM